MANSGVRCKESMEEEASCVVLVGVGRRESVEGEVHAVVGMD